ncbi:MAG TPA: hypothetical protein VMS38_22265 [Pseudorhodoferax sp.]|jgi:hypothetical protein|nr:hypothetical protein [Pseudorhodoferax sp.]
MAADLFSEQLAEVEAGLDTLTELLLQGDAPAYEQGMQALWQSLTQLVHHAHGGDRPNPLPATQSERLHRVARMLGRQRDQLARRAVVVERALSVVLPQAQPTYQPPGRRAGGFSGPAPRIFSAPAR